MFVVRVWAPSPEAPSGAGSALRGVVEQVSTGIGSPFATADELVALLRAMSMDEKAAQVRHGRDGTGTHLGRQ